MSQRQEELLSKHIFVTSLVRLCAIVCPQNAGGTLSGLWDRKRKERNNMSDPKNSETTRWNAKQVREQTKKSESPTGSSASKKRSHREKRKLGWLWYILGVLVASALLAGLAWLMINDVCALNKEPLTVTIEVEKDESVGQVASKLKDEGLIGSKTLFMIFGSLFHAKDIISPGTYELNSDMDFHCLINSMESSQSVVPEGVVRVTIPEGSTVKETIALLAENGVNTKKALTKAAKKHVFKDHPFVDNEHLGSINRLEGYLAPDTYEFFEGENPAKALGRMLDNFAVWMTDDMKADIKASGHSFEDIITMASLIEKESTGDDEDRANIASIMYNRIANPEKETGGLLQMDSTIYYILRSRGMKDSEFSTEIESPYNTYLHPGLPAGPICSPSRAAIMAAIYPSDTDYYYFALGKDGRDHFFTNYADHDAFVNSSEFQPV